MTYPMYSLESAGFSFFDVIPVPADQAAEQKETYYDISLAAACFKISSMYIRAG